MLVFDYHTTRSSVKPRGLTLLSGGAYPRRVSVYETSHRSAPTPSRRWLDLVYLGLLLVIGLAIALPRFRCGVDFADEGFLAYGAVRVSAGEMPNRDFVSLQPPLSFYVAAGVFKLLGTSLASLRVLGVLLYLVISLLSFAILRSFVSPTSAFVGALPPFVVGLPYFYFIPFAVWQGLTVSLLAAFFFLRAVLRENRIWAFVSGVFLAISTSLRHDQAAYLAWAILIFLLASIFFAREWRPVVFKLAGFWFLGTLLPSILLILFWWRANALTAMARQLILFPLTTYAKTSSIPFPRFDFAAPFPALLLTTLLYLPPLFYAAVATHLITVWLRSGFGRRHLVVLFLLAWGGFFYLQVVTRSDLNHFIITLPPFFILAASWVTLIGNRAPSRLFSLRGALNLSPVILLACGFPFLHQVFLPPICQGATALTSARGGIRMAGAEAINDFIRAIQTNVPPDRSLLVLPYQPMLYFLTERKNPTRWNYLWPGDQTDEEHAELVAEAERGKPALVILFGEDKMREYAPSVVDYVHREFHPKTTYRDLVVYVPNQDR